MTSAELFDVLWACRVYFQGPLVVQAGAESGVFNETPRVHYDDLRNNYNVPPTARSCPLLMTGTCFVLRVHLMHVKLFGPSLVDYISQAGCKQTCALIRYSGRYCR